METLAGEFQAQGFACRCDEHAGGEHAEHGAMMFADNTLAIPVAAGALYPSLRIMLPPEWAALLMSVSTITVTLNALLLNRVRLGAR